MKSQLKSTLKLLGFGLLALSPMTSTASACDYDNRRVVTPHKFTPHKFTPHKFTVHKSTGHKFTGHKSTQYRSTQWPSTQYVVFLKRPDSTFRNRPTTKRVTQPNPPMTVDAGASYRMTGHQFGNTIGSVLLTTGGVEIQCDIHTWSANEVTFQMPSLRLSRATKATLEIVVPSGEAVVSKPILLRGLQIEIAKPTLEPILEPAISESVLDASVHQSTSAQPLSGSTIHTEDAPLATDFDLGHGLDSL
jgi:hypothetical protein